MVMWMVILPLFDARGCSCRWRLLLATTCRILDFEVSVVDRGRDGMWFPTPGRIQYFQNQSAFRSSTRDGSAATMTIAGTTLTTAVTAGRGEKLSFDLTNASFNTVAGSGDGDQYS